MTNTATVDFLAHYGVKGMMWDHHVAPQDAPFIQRQGQAQQPPSGQRRPQFTPQERADRMTQLINLIHQSQAAATQQSGQEAQANPSPQATATHTANVAHLAQTAQAAKAATAANTAHKAATAKQPANSPANKAHAAKMAVKAKAAVKAHAAHKAKHPTKKGKKTTTKHPSLKTLTAKDKAALAKLKPAERAALAKLSPKERAELAKMTPADKKALSGLSQKQKDALHKAQLASAAKRHKDALARKAAAAASSTTKHSDLDDPVGTFLAHFGVKGQKWGVRRNGGHPGTYKAKVPSSSSSDHQQSALIKSKVKAHGGIHALSNDELETVNKRLNLEQSYHRLTSQPANADKGRAFVDKVIADAKRGVNLYNTINQVGKVASDIHSETKKRQARPRQQSSRTRNAPLRVVSVK